VVALQVSTASPFEGPAGVAESGPLEPNPASRMFEFQINRQRPLVAELYGWGNNQTGCLGVAHAEMAPEPVLLPLNMSLPVIERITAVAASERHTLVLTLLGSVYSCGDGTDGALGHGDLLSLSRFRIIEAFAQQQDPPPLIVGVSAGSDILGTQSAAWDSDGRLYTWGFGPATGLLSGKPVNRPTEVKTLVDLGEHVVGAACGGAFTAAVSREGRVYTWGLWAHGRLGIGPPAVQVDRYRRKRVHKYRLRPAVVRGKLAGERVVKLAAGTGHCLALTHAGRLYAWGRDDFGQLGLDPRPRVRTPFGSVFEPERVVELRVPGEAAAARVVDVACGAFHSLAVDAEGGLWTWGAAGASCLGHGDTVAVDSRRVKAKSLLKKQQSSARSVPVMMAKPAWATPRPVAALRDIRVRAASAGIYHSAAVSEDGRLFLWGESASVLRPIMARVEDLEESEENEEDKEEEEELRAVDVEGVEIPRQPCSLWLPRLAGKWVEAVACGGHNTLLVATGERVAMTLGRQLLPKGIPRGQPGDSDDHSDSER
jgi:alpha-tubulin suppressor-like RCC1 family protein